MSMVLPYKKRLDLEEKLDYLLYVHAHTAWHRLKLAHYCKVPQTGQINQEARTHVP